MLIKSWAVVVCSAVNLYLLGAMVLFAAIVYPGFAAVDRAAFPPLYQAFTSRIPVSVVAWEFAALLVTVPLYFARPSGVPAWAVHALMVLGAAYFAITFGWHLPAHRALATGDNSPQALAPLLSSQWARTAVQLVRAGLLVWMGSRG